MTEDELCKFAQSIGSVWTLELLILLRRDAGRGWDEQAAIRELRSSSAVVHDAFQRLANVGLVTRTPQGLFYYRPASAGLDGLAAAISELYAAKPMMVIKAVADAHTDRPGASSDTFNLKKD